jgi:hypothetical protein
LQARLAFGLVPSAQPTIFLRPKSITAARYAHLPLTRIESISRLARSVKDLLNIVESLKSKHAPYNKAVYELCKVEFAKDNFKPLTEQQVWEVVKESFDTLTD